MHALPPCWAESCGLSQPPAGETSLRAGVPLAKLCFLVVEFRPLHSVPTQALQSLTFGCTHHRIIRRPCCIPKPCQARWSEHLDEPERGFIFPRRKLLQPQASCRYSVSYAPDMSGLGQNPSAKALLRLPARASASLEGGRLDHGRPIRPARCRRDPKGSVLSLQESASVF